MDPSEVKRNGFFIVVEGIDGCGKDTQLERLAGYLTTKGYKVLLTNEPTDGPVGRLIREKGLSGKEKYTDLEMQLMFSLDRGYHVKNEIEPALSRGEIVLSGRYTLSTFAYGLAKGLDLELLEKANSGYREPDLVVYIDIGYETALKRLTKRGGKKEIYETGDMLRKSEESYKKILSKFRSEIIDGSADEGEVQKRIIAAVDRYI